MTLSDISIKRPIGMLVISAVIVIMGLFFLQRLSVDLVPRITYPMVRLVINWKGVSPEQIEENITQKVERQIAKTEDVISLLSNTKEGSVSMDIYFEFGKDMDVALQDVRAMLDLVRKDIPPDADEPILFKADPTTLPVLELAVYSSVKDEIYLRQWAENDLSNYFMGIPGLASVVASGGKIREIDIIFKPELLQRYELTTTEVLQALKEENIEYPSGRITSPDKEFMLRVVNKFNSVKDIEEVIIKNREGRPIAVKDIAKVTDTHEEQRLYTRFNQTPCVLLGFSKQYNANTVSVCEKIEKRAKELKRQGIIPPDINLKTANSQAYYIRSSIDNVGSSLILGAFLAMLVIWMFLHRWQYILIISISIPVAVLGTIMLMGLTDLTLNLFSLGGLVLGVGMLVDNSIVVLENIVRHQREQPDPLEASRIGSREVFSAVVASTTTTIVAIIPFLILKGLAALLFKDLVLTVMISIFMSLLVAITVVPSLTARIKKQNKPHLTSKRQALMDWLIMHYKKALTLALAHKWKVILMISIAFLATIFMISHLGSEFLPKIDDGKVTIKVKLPTGTPLAKTDSIIRKVEDLVISLPGVETVYVMSGGYWERKMTYEVSHQGNIDIQLVDKAKRPVPTHKFIKMLQEKLKELKIPKAKFKVIPSQIRGIKTTSTTDIDVRIKGYNIDTLYKLSEEVESKIKDIKGLSNLDISVDYSKPEMHVTIDRQSAGNFGLSTKQVADILRTTVDGWVSTEFTDNTVNLDYDIRMLADRNTFTGKESVENIALYPPNKAPIKLKDIASVRITNRPVEINRENQIRYIAVTGDVVGRNVGEAGQEVIQKLSDMKLPEGYTIYHSGEAESIKESRKTLIILIILAILLVYAVMAIQFESLLDPLVILFTIPLSLIGAVWALYITGIPFGATAELGLILLAGYVVNNGILLVEFIKILRQEQGMSLLESVLNAPPLRLRPILMSSGTTIAGLLPLAIGWGEGMEMLRPLAISVIGGLTVSMFLTLFVIPSLYLVFHRGKYNISDKK
jgi:CzcA family heavy metal efflux pump